MNTSLYICDNIEWITSENPSGSIKAKVAYVSSNYKEKKRLIEIFFKRLGAESVSDVNIPKLVNDTAFLIRDKYISWVDSFDTNNPELIELFNFRSLKIDLWRLTLFCEKNTLKSNSFYELSLMVGMLDYVQKNNIKNVYFYVTYPKPWIRDFVDTLAMEGNSISVSINSFKNRGERLHWLGDFKRFLLYIIRLIKVKYILALLRKRKSLDFRTRSVAVTYFPFLKKDALNNNKYKNSHYEELQTSLENRAGDKLGWIGMVVHSEFWNFQETLKAAAKINKTGITFDLLEEWITFGMVVMALACSMVQLCRRIKIMSLFVKGAIFKYKNHAFCVKEIFKREFQKSIFTLSFINILYCLAFRRIEKETNVSEIFYFAEMHAWEKALCSEFESHVRIGIQHSSIPLLLTNYSFGGNKITDSSYKRYYPDLIGCVGNTTLSLLKRSGFDQKTLFVLGAFRFNHYIFTKILEADTQTKLRKILVPLTILPGETEELLELLDTAFQEIDYELLIKPHPAINLSQRVKDVINKNINFKLVHEPLEILCREVCGMIVTSSTSCFFAINEGIPVVVPRLIERLDMNPVSGIEDLLQYVDGPDELREIVNSIIENNSINIDIKKNRYFLFSYIDLVKDSKEYMKRIDQAVLSLKK